MKTAYWMRAHKMIVELRKFTPNRFRATQMVRMILKGEAARVI